jgi:FixJ family two-component response regulator
MGGPVVYVVDDDPSVRRSVQRLLAAADYQVTAFASGREFVDAYDGNAPGCLLLDQCLPDASGLDLLERLEQHESPLSVVFVSGHGDVPTTVAAMKHGALDFLTKPFEEHAILAAVAAALKRSAAKWAERQERAALWRRFDTLTPREREVCRLVAAGYLNKQTAYELGTAEKTVKVHRARVMSKLEVGSLAELVRLVDRLHPAAAIWHGGRSVPAATSVMA